MLDEQQIQKLVKERDGLALDKQEREKHIKELEKMLDQASPEAIYSFSTIALSKDGMGATWTVRGRCGENAASFYARVDSVLQSLLKHGWATASKPEMKQAALPPTKTESAPAATVQSTEPPETFKAQSLVATMNEGKIYWKVKGGRYGKFGVTIWGETLAEAGFDVAQLDASKVYDVSAFTAHVWKNEEGKPTKIFKLTK